MPSPAPDERPAELTTEAPAASVPPSRLAPPSPLRPGLRWLALGAAGLAALGAGLALDRRNAEQRSEPLPRLSAAVVARDLGITPPRLSAAGALWADELPLVSLSRSELRAGGATLAKVPPPDQLGAKGFGAESKGGDGRDPVIAPLYEHLSEVRARLRAVDKARREQGPQPVREVVAPTLSSGGLLDDGGLRLRLLADASTPVRAVQEVLGTAADAGFTSVSLVVERPSGGLGAWEVPDPLGAIASPHAVRVEVREAGLSVGYDGRPLGPGCVEGEGLTLPRSAKGQDTAGLLACIDALKLLNLALAKSPAVKVIPAGNARLGELLAVVEAVAPAAPGRLSVRGLTGAQGSASRRLSRQLRVIEAPAPSGGD